MIQRMFVTLDTKKTNYKNVGKINHGDDLILELTVLSDGDMISFNDPMVDLLVKKSDGKMIRQNSGIEHIKPNKFVIEVMKDCVTSPGLSTNQLIINDNGRISTCMFYYTILNSLEEDIIQSISNVEVLEQLDEFTIQMKDKMENFDEELQNRMSELEDVIDDLAEFFGDTGVDLLEAEFRRNEAEQSRAQAESVRVQNENRRLQNDLDLANAEAERVRAENIRIQNEVDRALVDGVMDQKESKREDSELERIQNESKRATDEVARQQNENTRQSNESIRMSNESDRKTQENRRATAETNRVNAETTRRNNENSRISNENSRISNENERQKTIKEMKSLLEDARGFDNRVGVIEDEIEEINSSLDNLENEVNELKEGNINIDLTNYVTKNELSTKADKTELHSHSNKTVLDGITTSKISEWNNKSTFSGNYNDLTNKPTIPTLNGYATEQYVNEEIKKIDVTEQLTDYAKKSELHSHTNKTVLDGITSAKITEWNNKSNFSGSYNDLVNKPTIPTNTSQLTNDSGFITSIPNEYVTETELNNKGYLTQHQDISGKADKSTLTSHTSDTTIHITEAERNKWNNMSNGNTGNGNNTSSLIIDLKSLGVMEGNNTNTIENNTAILQGLIEQYPKGQMTFYLSKGTYYFNPIDLTNISGSIIIKLKGENNGMSTSWFKGMDTTIKTNKQDFIYDRRSSSPGITFYVDDIKFYSFDGYNNIPTGVCFGAENGGHEYNFHFYNVLIHGFDYGFKSPGFSCAGSGGKNIYLSTCHYGIYIKSTSHLFQADCVELAYNRVGIRFGTGGSPSSISNIHVASGYLGADKDDFDRFIVIHTKGGTHISNLYQEAYENNAQPEKTTIIDYEGWAYGIGPVIVENTPIAIPSSKGGLFFKGRTFLGPGPEEGADPPMEIYSGNLSHYPDGCAKFINCKIGNNVDITSIFDVPAQSPGYDINNKMYYKDSKIINKNSIGKINSKWTYTIYSLSPITHEGNIYETYNNAFFNEPCNGFKLHELRVLKNIDPISNIKLKGNIIIEDTLSDALDAGIGFLHTYYIDGVVNYKFYPVTTLKASQEVSSFPFDFVIERVTGEDVRTQINICTMFKNETNKLESTDFAKIRFKFDIEVYRDL